MDVALNPTFPQAGQLRHLQEQIKKLEHRAFNELVVMAILYNLPPSKALFSRILKIP